jgi:hypothetical protein
MLNAPAALAQRATEAASSRRPKPPRLVTVTLMAAEQAASVLPRLLWTVDPNVD